MTAPPPHAPPARPADLNRLTERLRLAAEACAHAGGRRPEADRPAPVRLDTLPLARRALHEWFADAPPQGLWVPAAAAAATLHPGHVFWVGRACWPCPAALPAALARRSVFVRVGRHDPAARVWTADLLLRSPAAAAVFADGRDLDAAASRRLQLAAEAGDALSGLWGGPARAAGLSVAHYRWAAAARPGRDRPRWRVERLRGKDATLHAAARPGEIGKPGNSGDPAHPAPPATVFDVKQNDATSLVAVPDPLADRPVASGHPTFRTG